MVEARSASSIVGTCPAGIHQSATYAVPKRWNHSRRRRRKAV